MSSLTFPDTLVFRDYAAPVRIESTILDLEVEGVIPAELDGCYIRNSADHRFPPLYDNDLFLNGDGMLHKVRIADGHADLQTRYVRTEKFMLEQRARKALFGAYRNPYTSHESVREKNGNTANTSVVWHGGVLLALKESARPMRIDPETLETLGEWDFNGALTSQTFTAHPKIDPATGEMVAFSYFTKGVADTRIEVHFVDKSGVLTRTEALEAPYPSMVHDFMLSENYVAFTICPMVCDWTRVESGYSFFHWDNTKPTMVGVMPRGPGGGERVRWFKSPAAVMETHTFNAWEEGDILHLDHFVNTSGWLSQFPDINDPQAQEAPPFAWRWSIDLRANHEDFTATRLFPQVGEMPMVDHRFLTRRTRHFWFGTFNPELGPMLPRGPKGPPFTCLGHFDAGLDTLEYFYAGPSSAPEEPIFVPRNGSTEEGDGWLMTIVGRRALNRSDLVILDARDLTAGPVATIKFPCRVHEGFHGIWIPGQG